VKTPDALGTSVRSRLRVQSVGGHMTLRMPLSPLRTSLRTVLSLLNLRIGIEEQ